MQLALACCEVVHLIEGFGLIVTEAMWKARPELASAVGGIRDQIVHRRDGVLLANPHDVPGFGQRLQELLDHRDGPAGMGRRGRERVRDYFLGDRHLIQYVELFDELLGT